MNVVTFAEDILSMSRELGYLRKEVARLKRYEAEYTTLVRDSIRHSEQSTINTLNLLKVPGVSEALQAAQLPEGFTPWTGGERPVDKCIRVELLLRKGDRPTGAACDCRWNHCGNGEDIVGYRVISALKGEVPEGFTPWEGGECPVPAETQVEAVFDDGLRGFCAAAYLRWASTNPPRHGNITAYRVVK